MTQSTIPEVPYVNLLDPECEPSDEALSALMRAVAADVRERATRANAALRATIERETEAAWAAHRRRTSD
jgi:hypothetical protein